MQAVQAWVALGGNLGDVRLTLQQARHALALHPTCQVEASSLLYSTPPLGPAGQPDYLNAVIALHTSLEAADLLALLHRIEHDHGRERRQHWGARTLDLDLLAYDQQVSDRPELRLPHPQLAERQFVLRPWCDIAPDWRHPLTGETVLQMLQLQLQRSGEQALPEGELW